MNYIQVMILSATGEVRSVAVSAEAQPPGFIHQYEVGTELDVYNFEVDDEFRRGRWYMSRLEKAPGLDKIRFKPALPANEKKPIFNENVRKNVINGKPK